MPNTRGVMGFGKSSLIERKKARKKSSKVLSTGSAHLPHGEEPSQLELRNSQYEGNGFPMPGSPSSAWFRKQFDILYEEVVEFVNTNFCQSDIEIAESGTNPWTKGMLQELLNYTQLVAEADESPESWDLMLLDRKKRGHLLVGVLGRILEAHIFRELLFGTSPEHKEQLEKEEASLPGREGFSRTAVRAENIVKALGDRQFPGDFQITVLRLSRQITILLLPLWRLLQATDASALSYESREVQLVDGLEKIVSKAGKLSVHIRRSPTIVYFDFETPGSGFVWNDQYDVDNIDHKAYVANKDATLTRLADNPSKGISSMDRFYHPGVKISVWPSIKRYLPGDGQHGGSKRGFRIYNICNSRVVYHWRLKDRRNGSVKSLSEFVEIKNIRTGLSN